MIYLLQDDKKLGVYIEAKKHILELLPYLAKYIMKRRSLQDIGNSLIPDSTWINMYCNHLFVLPIQSKIIVVNIM